MLWRKEEGEVEEEEEEEEEVEGEEEGEEIKICHFCVQTEKEFQTMVLPMAKSSFVNFLLTPLYTSPSKMGRF